jgi:hypothetical protein
MPRNRKKTAALSRLEGWGALANPLGGFASVMHPSMTAWGASAKPQPLMVLFPESPVFCGAKKNAPIGGFEKTSWYLSILASGGSIPEGVIFSPISLGGDIISS